MEKENLLFQDSEVFKKERPLSLSDIQKESVYKQLAEEIIENDWSDDNIEDIISDLKSLSFSNSGYEKAKELESFNAKASYSIGAEFIEFLDWFSNPFDDLIEENQRRWVSAHKIQPKIKIGQELIINERFSRAKDLQIGKTIFVNGYKLETGMYLVNEKNESSSNYIVSYESIEENCKLVTELNETSQD
jgi:hypothetical protein